MEAFAGGDKKDDDDEKPPAADKKEEEDPAAETLFGPKQCEVFISKHLPIMLGKEKAPMLFKVKKTLLPCLLAVGNHISYELFVRHVFETF
jgi:hypothetical protein